MHDWDSTAVPVLADLTIGGQPRKVVMFANRNGFFYTLDRVDRQADRRQAVRRDDLGEGDRRRRPADLLPGHTPTRTATVTCPDLWGGTNFMPPSYDPTLSLFFVTARETCATYFAVEAGVQGRRDSRSGGGVRRVARSQDYGALRAIDPSTGERKWEFRYTTPSLVGRAVDRVGPRVRRATTTATSWRSTRTTAEACGTTATGASIWGAAATTYMLDGRQYVLIPSGAALVAFALPN